MKLSRVRARARLESVITSGFAAASALRGLNSNLARRLRGARCQNGNHVNSSDGDGAAAESIVTGKVISHCARARARRTLATKLSRARKAARLIRFRPELIGLGRARARAWAQLRVSGATFALRARGNCARNLFLRPLRVSRDSSRVELSRVGAARRARLVVSDSIDFRRTSGAAVVAAGSVCARALTFARARAQSPKVCVG